MKRLLLPLLIIVLALGIAVALFLGRDKPEVITATEKAWGVHVRGIELSQQRPVLRLYGRIDSPRTSKLTAALEAYVVQLQVQEGEWVKQGQLLVKLDETEAALLVAQREAEIAQIQADIASEETRKRADEVAMPNEKKLLSLARQAVHRAKDLRKRKVASQSTLDDAQQGVVQQTLALQKRQQSLDEAGPRMQRLTAALARATALLDSAKLDLQRCEIIAPYDGRIANVSVAKGDRVRKGSALVELFDHQALRLRAQLPERVVSIISRALVSGESLAATAQVDGQPLQLRLTALAGKVSSAASAVEALLTIESQQQVERASLVLGRLLDFELQLPVIDNVATVPQEAIYGTNRLYIEESGRMHGINVQILGVAQAISEKTGINALLVRGAKLKTGQKLIVTQLPNAIEGLRIRVIEPAANHE